MQRESLKSKLLNAVYKSSLTRKELKEIADEHPAERSAAERKIREICEEYNVYPVDRRGRRVTQKNSFLISKWKWYEKKKVRHNKKS